MTASEPGAVRLAATSPGRAVRRRLVRGSATVFVGMAVGTVLTLILNHILANTLGPSLLGQYFLVFSMVTIGSTVAQMGLDRTVVRLVSASRGVGDAGRARHTVRVVYTMGLASSLLLAAVLMLGLGHFVAIHIYHSEAIAAVIGLTAAWVVVKALLLLTAETFRGFQRFWPATVYSGLAVDGLLAAAFGALWIAGARPSLREAVAISVAATAIALAVALISLRGQVSRLHGDGDVRAREIASISVPLLVTSVASFVVGTGVDLWVVGHFRPATDVALYGAASRLVFFVATPFIIVSQVVPPIIAELYARGEKEQLESSLRSISTLAGIPAALMLIVFVVAGRLRDGGRLHAVLPGGGDGARHPELRPARRRVHGLERRDPHDDGPSPHDDGAHRRDGHRERDGRDPARPAIRDHRRRRGDVRRADDPEHAAARVCTDPRRHLDTRPVLARAAPGARAGVSRP